MPFQIAFGRPWPPPEAFEALPASTRVGQADRTWLIPLLHRTLAAPEDANVNVWPRYDKSTGLADACAYWESAVYLLACMLGWRDLGVGLQRYYQAVREQRPLGSAHLDLLEQVWNDHQQLDLLALWAWENHVEARGGASLTQAPHARRPDAFLGDDWHRDLTRRHPGYGIAYDHDPYWGGENPLHLGHALGAFSSEAHRDAEFIVDVARKRASLQLTSMRGWAHALERIASATVGRDPSFRVNVYVRPVGWLGTFRRSTETGRWFLGRHSIHEMGFAA